MRAATCSSCRQRTQRATPVAHPSPWRPCAARTGQGVRLGHGRLDVRAAPENDLFAAAQPISAWHGLILGSTAFATSERRERARRSVWFSWRAPAGGRLALEAGTGTQVSVYTGGSVAALRPVATGAARVSFTALPGTRYRIAVDGIRTKFALAWRPG